MKIEKIPDQLLVTIANYVHDTTLKSELAIQTAHHALLDSLACALYALQVPACIKLLGPIVSDSVIPLGARVPGTKFELDPIKAAFDIGTCIRWLDYNDTWLALEWGHPSDNLGGILAIADYLSRREPEKKKTILMKTVIDLMIKAYEIQGVLALENAFNRVGLDHVVLVKLATTAVVSKLLGLNKSQTVDALSQVFIDGQSLRTYRHAPNTGSRKSWAAGDATSRGVQLAWFTHLGEMGYPTAITAKTWGFNDVLFKGESIKLTHPLECYVMENILFKVAFPAEFHAQTAVECAIKLYPKVRDKWDEIDKIEVITHEAAMRIINKEGTLYNEADRDHCLQYMIAIALLYGELKAEHYTNEFSKDLRIDTLRQKMRVTEKKEFSIDYLAPTKRAIPNSLQIFFKDGIKTEQVTIEYPLGHRLRRTEAEPFLKAKYELAISTHFANDEKREVFNSLWENLELTLQMPVEKFMDLWAK